MTERKFKMEMLRTAAMRKICGDPIICEYWSGYMRGLRRGYHGNNFGTAEEHGRWMAAINSRGENRKQRGRGYRDGLAFMAKNQTGENQW